MVVSIVLKWRTSNSSFKSFFIHLHRLTRIDQVDPSLSECHRRREILLLFADLLYFQHVKAMGNRQTFHPNKLDYDLFNIEIDLGPINLLLHGWFLKKLWSVKENLVGWEQMYHDICQPEMIREKKIIVHDDPLVDLIDESQPFDPRYFRPLMVTLCVALHKITAHLTHHTDDQACPIAFCERVCFEMTTDLGETRLQLLFRRSISTLKIISRWVENRIFLDRASAP